MEGVKLTDFINFKRLRKDGYNRLAMFSALLLSLAIHGKLISMRILGRGESGVKIEAYSASIRFNIHKYHKAKLKMTKEKEIEEKQKTSEKCNIMLKNHQA